MKRITFAMCAICALAACGEEPPPRSVAEFMEDSVLLEATMVRCGQNRDATRYDVECVNARDAVDRLAAAAEQAKKQELEARSERKRQALRRAQEAAAAARQRALEAARLRDEAAYLGQFEPLPADGEQPESTDPAEPAGGAPPDIATNGPAAEAPAKAEDSASPVPRHPQDPLSSEVPGELPGALPGGPEGAPETAAEPEGSDLDSVREELKRRQDEALQ
jgi:hypothetical protein